MNCEMEKNMKKSFSAFLTGAEMLLKWMNWSVMDNINKLAIIARAA